MTRATCMAVCLCVVFSAESIGAAAHPDASPPTDTVRTIKSYGTLPLSFEANRGQASSPVQFIARGHGFALFLTPQEAVLKLQKTAAATDQPAGGSHQNPAPGASAVLRMKLVGAQENPAGAGLDELPGKHHYYRGRDPAQWLTNVPSFSHVRYEGVYPGIDLLYYGNQRQLEYDFIVAPGADPATIAMEFKGAERPVLNEQGDLLLAMGTEKVRLQKPFIYQQQGDTRREVPGSYSVSAAGTVSFDVAAYDRSMPLVIDPILVYSTFIGGSNPDVGTAIAVDGIGQAHITGWTESEDFPVTDLSVFGGGSVFGDAFVTKLNAAGTALVWSTYLGGDITDQGFGIAVDGDGNVYVTGTTNSSNFPTTPGAFQEVRAEDPPGNIMADAFVTKMDGTGTIVWSTYLGGTHYDLGKAIAVDGDGRPYVTGNTGSDDFPTLNGFATSINPLYGDIFVSVLTAEGDGLVYSTYLGGCASDNANGIAVDSDGMAYVTGETQEFEQGECLNFPTTIGAYKVLFASETDAFVAKLNPAGLGAASLVYSTYLGGDLPAGNVDRGYGIAVDAAHNAYVVGHTESTDFPTTPDAFQSIVDSQLYAFVTKLNPAGSDLLFSTVFGGSECSQAAAGVALDAEDMVYITGWVACTLPPDFPIKGVVQGATGNGNGDAFIAKLDPAQTGDDQLVWSTFLGGDDYDFGNGIAVDGAGSAYIVGSTSSPGDESVTPSFPFTISAFDTSFNGVGDGFVSKIGENDINSAPSVTNDGSQSATQYSDDISPVTIEALDDDGLPGSGLEIDSTEWKKDGDVAFTPGLPSDLSLTPVDAGTVFARQWTLSGAWKLASGKYFVKVSVSDGLDTGNTTVEINISKENADVTPALANLAALAGNASGNTVAFSLAVDITDIDDTPSPGNRGDISKSAQPGPGEYRIMLVPVGPGPTITCDTTFATTLVVAPIGGLGGTSTATCNFAIASVPVNVYEVIYAVQTANGYYTGESFSTFTQYDPAAGASGGGWFYWPGTSDKTNYGVTMKYTKKGTNPQGNALVLRHRPDGHIIRMKSNSITTVAVKAVAGQGQGTMVGKATYYESETGFNSGNNKFTIYLEDNNEPGSGLDRVWLQLSGKPMLLMPSTASANAVPIEHGNNAIPHLKAK